MKLFTYFSIAVLSYSNVYAGTINTPETTPEAAFRKADNKTNSVTVILPHMPWKALVVYENGQIIESDLSSRKTCQEALSLLQYGMTLERKRQYDKEELERKRKEIMENTLECKGNNVMCTYNSGIAGTNYPSTIKKAVCYSTEEK